MKKFFLKKYLRNKYVIVGVIVLAIVIYFAFFRGSSSPSFDFATASIGNVIERVSVTGKISPVEKADLAFERGGVVKVINFKVGDRVKKGDIIASLDSSADRATLASAEAKLSDLSRGLNAPELALEKSKISAASTSLANAKQDALNASRIALVQTQGAINNYADTFFDNPQSANPTINVRTDSQSRQTSINYQRVLVTDILTKWRRDLDLIKSPEDASRLISAVNGYETIIKNFVDELATIVNSLDTGNSGLSRATIDTHVSNINTALSSLNQAITSISTAKSTLENAITNYDQIYNNFVLKNSGSSAQAIAVQSAIVDSYRAELAKNWIVAPMNGIITKAEPKLGEFVSAGVISYGVISDGEYKIEAFVPEADIAKISVGDISSTTLDAYQNVDFLAEVVSIDPAETILEGVPTYKVTLRFKNRDDRIRSGMTANLEILTEKRDNVLTVPSRAIITEENLKYVRVLDSNRKDFTKVPIEQGLKGSDGLSEIINGIQVGDEVVTYIKK